MAKARGMPGRRSDPRFTPLTPYDRRRLEGLLTLPQGTLTPEHEEFVNQALSDGVMTDRQRNLLSYLVGLHYGGNPFFYASGQGPHARYSNGRDSRTDYDYGSYRNYSPPPPPPRQSYGWRAVLGVGQQATAKEVRRAYRDLALKYHPDRGGDGEKMRAINLAMEQARRELRF